MKKEDVSLLSQLIGSLEKSGLKLEEAFERKDSEDFIRIKKFMIEMQKKIAEVIR